MSAVGYGRSAQRALDSTLPLKRRLSALSECISLSGPYGYNATWRYLEAHTGTERSAPGFLEPVIEHLTRYRELRSKAISDFAQLRRAEKAKGLRLLDPAIVTAGSPARWFGDERAAAIHLLAVWAEPGRLHAVRTTEFGRTAAEAADHLLLDGDPSEVTRGDLQDALDQARKTTQTVDYRTDRTTYASALQAHRLLGQLKVLLDGPLVLGERWDFA
jgi:hypothetical protein